MGWRKHKPAPLSPFVQDVIDLLAQPARWTFSEKKLGAFEDFGLAGPEGLIVARGSYDGFWYTVRVGEDEIKLEPRDWRAIEPAAQAAYRFLRQPEINRERLERTKAGARIAAALQSAKDPRSVCPLGGCAGSMGCACPC